MVATITRIRDAILAIFTISSRQSCQSQHLNSVNHTQSTLASVAQQTYNSNLFSALKSQTNQLLLNTSVNYPLFQMNIFSVSASNTTPQTPSATSTGPLTFQSTPNSGVNSTCSSNEGPASPNLELSKKEIIENNLTQLFTKVFLTVLTSK